MVDTPRLSAKKACPSAVSMVCGVKCDQSGLSRKEMPAIAPSSVSERTAKSSSNTNSAGIMYLLARSMPAAMPLFTTHTVISINSP